MVLPILKLNHHWITDSVCKISNFRKVLHPRIHATRTPVLITTQSSFIKVLYYYHRCGIYQIFFDIKIKYLPKCMYIHLIDNFLNIYTVNCLVVVPYNSIPLLKIFLWKNIYDCIIGINDEIMVCSFVAIWNSI